MSGLRPRENLDQLDSTTPLSIGVDMSTTEKSVPPGNSGSIKSAAPQPIVNTQPGAQTDSPKVLSQAPIDQNTVFWKAYNDAGDREDKEFVKAAGSDLDALLIFAGLFSATNTAFIIESYKNLKPDQAEKTNKILLSVLQAIRDPSQAIIDAPSFAASSRDIRINAYFFTSLCCSLSAAFGAVLAKQWLTQYDQDSGRTLKEPAARGRERQRKYMGRDYWHLEDVIVLLPTLLQLSLFFFFVGLVDFLWPLSEIVTSIALSFTIATFLFYVTTIAISVATVSAPFQTRLSHVIRLLPSRTWALIVHLGPRSLKDIPTKVEANLKVVQDVNIDCFSYLLDRMTKLEDLGILADAFVSLSCSMYEQADPDERKAEPGDERAATVVASFVDFHLKPIRSWSGWSIPNLYEGERVAVPLLKILHVLVKRWRDLNGPSIKTPLYPTLRTSELIDDIPGELKKAFLVDPSDTESCRWIVNNLLALHPDDASPPYNRRDKHVWQAAWLEGDVVKNLKTLNDATQQNTLAVLTVVARDCRERKGIWDMVKSAKKNNPMLSKNIHSIMSEEIASTPSKIPAHSPRSLPFLEWMAMSDDLEELAQGLLALPRELDGIVTGEPSLVHKAVKKIMESHLQATSGELWELPGLHGQNKKSLLSILHVIIVRWKCAESVLSSGAGPHPSVNLSSNASSLRAELWKVFRATPENSDIAGMIADICKNLPSLASSIPDTISPTLMKRFSVEISTQFQDDEAKPKVLKNCFSLLCANANSLISLAHFHAIRPAPGTSRAIVEHLRSTMWVKDAADLEDRWRATFRVQLLPASFPNKLHELRFAEYLNLWFQRYLKKDTETQVTGEGSTAHDNARQALRWTYLLSLLRLLTSADSPEQLGDVKKKLIEHDHRLSLLGILTAHRHTYSTWTPIALHLLLSLQPDGISDLKLEIVKGIAGALASGALSLDTMSQDIKKYSESSRLGDKSEEQWSGEISDRVARHTGQMVIQLMVSPEILGSSSETVPDDSKSLSLSAWMAIFGGAEGLADALEALPGGLGVVSAPEQQFVATVVDTLAKSEHLSRTDQGWWQLPGLGGRDKRSLLRIILVVVVGCKPASKADLDKWALSNQPLHTLVSSLRAELWEAFPAASKDPEDVRLIAEICRNLSMPSSDGDKDIIPATKQKVIADMSELFQNDHAKPDMLDAYLSFLSSNADAVGSVAAFHAIIPTTGTSGAILNLLRSNIWNEGGADLEDFWKATLRVQLLPTFFPDNLGDLRFTEYLHLYLQRYRDEARSNQRRLLPLCWAYLLSLQRILSTSEASKLATELVQYGHPQYLLGIFDGHSSDQYDTCATLALYSFLCLWSHDTSRMKAEDVTGVLNGLGRANLSLTSISRDIGRYAQSSRVADMTDDQWAEEVSRQVTQDMGEMVEWLYSYLEAAARGNLVNSGDWKSALEGYSWWCAEVDGRLATHEHRRLAENLRSLGPR